MFFYKNGPDETKQSAMIQKCPDGGLELIDIQHFICLLDSGEQGAQQRTNTNGARLVFENSTRDFLKTGWRK